MHGLECCSLTTFPKAVKSPTQLACPGNKSVANDFRTSEVAYLSRFIFQAFIPNGSVLTRSTGGRTGQLPSWGRVTATEFIPALLATTGPRYVPATQVLIAR